MGTYTDNLEFYMPVGHEGLIGTPYTDPLNANWIKLDTILNAGAVNVRDPRYGAMGDGTTDDTAALQAAITAAEAYRKTEAQGGQYMGNTVCLPPGVYTISSPLVVTPGVPSLNAASINIIGAGYNASKIRWKAGVAAPTSMIRMQPSGAGVNQGALWQGFLLDGHNIAKRGIWLTDIDLMTFDSLSFTGFTAGTGDDAHFNMDFANSGCLLNTIRMCHFGNGDASGPVKGLVLSNCNSNTIISNEFSSTPNGSLKVGGNANFVVFNDFEGLSTDGKHSIEVVGPRNTIAYNRFEDITGSRPNSRAIKFGNSQVELGILGNSFGEAGASDYTIEIGNSCSEVWISGNIYANPATVANIKVGTGCAHIRTLGDLNTGANHVEDNTVGGSVAQALTSTYPWGYNRLTINKPYNVDSGDARAHLDVNGQVFTSGVATFTKAGAPVDGDFSYVRDGMMAVNTSNDRFYVRIGGTWRYVTLT